MFCLFEADGTEYGNRQSPQQGATENRDTRSAGNQTSRCYCYENKLTGGLLVDPAVVEEQVVDGVGDVRGVGAGRTVGLDLIEGEGGI